MRPAENFEKLEKGRIKCLLCPNFCTMKDGENGKCFSRGVRGGQLQLLNYAKVVAANIDPIEKKPLYHYFPGRPILSVGSYGCNLRCRFCQNSDISQFEQPSALLVPDKLLQKAFHLIGNIGVAFTYNEPGIWFEYILDSAKLLKGAGLKTVLVTNGYLCQEPFKRLCEITDAMNIDLKAFNQKFYQEICQGDLETVKQNIAIAVKMGVHVELTNLLISGLNDNKDEFSQMIDWVASLSDKIPFHISRYFPSYLENTPATDPALIEEFVRIARQKLKFVYAGNTMTDQNTFCPECKEMLIGRSGYATSIHFSGSTCKCGYKLPFVV